MARIEAAACRWSTLAAIFAMVVAPCATPRPAKMTCGSCHREEARSQPQSEMGTAIELPPAQDILKAHPKLTLEANGYTYEIERKGETSNYTVRDASGSLTLPIRYAFGVGNQTFVLQYQGKFYESMVSSYQGINGLAITLGDERLRPRNLVEAMGRATSNDEITACFNCHGTGGVSQGKLTLAALQPGVLCEHCHEGAAEHLQSVAGGKPAAVPKKLGEMAAEDMSNFCGQCHRTWEAVVGQRLFGAINVRFQPYRLANSKCFQGDDRRIRCTACHNPHAALVRETASYDRACLACHDKKPDMQKHCPVENKNCVSCHMPKVQVPGSPSVFTDHEIRVVQPGQPYPD
jgi:hypothetical protein